jgi:hypothetical protein
MPVNKSENIERRQYFFWEKEFYTTRNISQPSIFENENPVADFVAPPPDLSYGSEIPNDESVRESITDNDSAESVGAPGEEAEPVIVFEHDPIVLSPFAGNQDEAVHADMLPEQRQEPEHAFQASNEIPKAVQEEQLEELQFTPYHTIDYFASQGIQYEQEENPSDKFGKQLKSFTAWLKSMKKLPKAVMESEMSDTTEAAIQSIAEHSIEEKEVITEAMAEVLALQGKRDKAIDLYRKLSLLNPDKSAFFAARIDQLK